MPLGSCSDFLIEVAFLVCREDCGRCLRAILCRYKCLDGDKAIPQQSYAGVIVLGNSRDMTKCITEVAMTVPQSGKRFMEVGS